jgi:excisionase family DNA binding protein
MLRPDKEPATFKKAAPELLTLGELASSWKVSKSTIRKWIRNGRLKPVRLCRRVLISQEEAERFCRQS